MSPASPIALAVARYAATVHAAAPAGHHVVSPLGAWLVLALAAGAAGETLADLLPAGPTVLEARQVALASYTREGFEAAAVTAVYLLRSAVLSATEVPRRTLHLRFDRPYAVVAVAVRPDPEAPPRSTRAGPACRSSAPGWPSPPRAPDPAHRRAVTPTRWFPAACSSRRGRPGSRRRPRS